MSAADEYRDFYAICDHMPGKDRVLRVGGTVICPTTGWSARLEPTEGNTGINQFMLHLDLVVTPPAPDTPVIEVRTPESAEWRQSPPALEYTDVEFHRSDADPPPTIKVEHPG
jgi:hypothetical protein